MAKKFDWMQIRCLRIELSQPFKIIYKYSVLSSEEYKVIDVAKRNASMVKELPPVLPLLYANG